MDRKKILLFIEQVVLNAKQNQGYALPDIIKDTNDVQALVNIIEKDPELFKMVYAADPGYNKISAADIWKKISADPEGYAIAKKYQDALNYRISSARARGPGMEEGAYEPQKPGQPESTRPIDAYDKRANMSGRDIGSFYDFFTSNRLRSNEVSGGSPGSSPLQ
jgi:hypothetical protein